MEYLVGVSLLLRTFVESLLLVFGEFDPDDLLNTFSADYDRHSEADILLTVFSVLGNAAGDDSLLVVEYGPYDACSTCAGCLQHMRRGRRMQMYP